MKECTHGNYIDIYPNDCFIHKLSFDTDEGIRIKTIKIRICIDCKQIIDIRDYGE